MKYKITLKDKNANTIICVLLKDDVEKTAWLKLNSDTNRYGKTDHWVNTKSLTQDEVKKVLDVRQTPTKADPKATESLLASDYSINVETLANESNDQKLAALRQERNKRIADTDYTQLADAPLNSTQKQAMREYRQALRDMPENVNLDNVIWPTPPIAVS